MSQSHHHDGRTVSCRNQNPWGWPASPWWPEMVLALILTTLITAEVMGAQETQETQDQRAGGPEFRWKVQPPFLRLDGERFPPVEKPWVAIKDPSIVRHEDRWHLFCTIRRGGDDPGRIRIGYLSFDDWDAAQSQSWQLLPLTSGYHGAPQVFYFEPQKTWYLIYQAEDSERGLRYGPCYSRNPDITDVAGWTRPQPLYVVPEGEKAGLDFWVICDDQKAHLFFTTLDGRMWRSETRREDFPDQGWSRPQIALKADLYEASHTYCVTGSSDADDDYFLTLVEAQDGGRRYFKAYRAEQLDGEWRPVAVSRSRPFVSPQNVVNQDHSWATSYSHGELIRDGFDQRLRISEGPWTLMFQGVDDAGRSGKPYGAIPWKLGLLKQQ